MHGSKVPLTYSVVRFFALRAKKRTTKAEKVPHNPIAHAR
jgi:hypothetical protein